MNFGTGTGMEIDEPVCPMCNGPIDSDKETCPKFVTIGGKRYNCYYPPGELLGFPLVRSFHCDCTHRHRPECVPFCAQTLGWIQGKHPDTQRRFYIRSKNPLAFPYIQSVTNFDDFLEKADMLIWLVRYAPTTEDLERLFRQISCSYSLDEIERIIGELYPRAWGMLREIKLATLGGY